jgi:hypothetical protein
MPVHSTIGADTGCCGGQASGRPDPGQPVPPADGTERATGLRPGLDLVKNCDPR